MINSIIKEGLVTKKIVNDVIINRILSKHGNDATRVFIDNS